MNTKRKEIEKWINEKGNEFIIQDFDIKNAIELIEQWENHKESIYKKSSCPNFWHDGLHDGYGICPDCGETF